MTHSIDFLVKELDKLKINDDGFFGNDLIFLNKLIEKVEEEIEQQNVEDEVAFYLLKKSKSICCETWARNIDQKVIKIN